MAKDSEIIYGIHSVRHALQQDPSAVLELWLQRGSKIAGDRDIKQLADGAGASIQVVPEASLTELCGSAQHQGLVIRRRKHHSGVADLGTLLANTTPDGLLFLVLDGVQDPHNLGACLRTANAAGVTAVIIPRDRAVQVNATVHKVASGAAEYLPVLAVTNLARTLEQLQAHGVWCYGLDTDAEKSLYDIDLTGPAALVLGAEGKGLRQNTRMHCDAIVALPMAGQVESLNVSAAAAVCLYEAVRQRTSVKSKK